MTAIPHGGTAAARRLPYCADHGHGGRITGPHGDGRHLVATMEQERAPERLTLSFAHAMTGA